jgi:hypothetical protein
MQKPEKSLVPLGPREKEILAHIKAGKNVKEIAEAMGIMTKSVPAYASMLRAKGYLPPIPPKDGRRRRTEPPVTREEVEKEKLEKVRAKESTGLAIQQVESRMPAEPPPAAIADVETHNRRRRRGSGDGDYRSSKVSITTRVLAEELDKSIQQYIAEGGRLEKWHRWAIVLCGSILE